MFKFEDYNVNIQTELKYLNDADIFFHFVRAKTGNLLERLFLTNINSPCFSTFKLTCMCIITFTLHLQCILIQFRNFRKKSLTTINDYNFLKDG